VKLSARPLPVTVIGGYLGSGKTTLINRLLGQKGRCRVAVLVNDFGSLNIDATLIDTASEKTITLTNGCVCCIVGDDLGVALGELSAVANELDHVLMEASGVADGVKLGSQARTWPGFVLAQVTTLVDVSRSRQLVRDKFVGRHVTQQLIAADLLVLTKTDLLSQTQLQAFAAWLDDFTDVPMLNSQQLDVFRLLAADVSAARVHDDFSAPELHPQLQTVTYRSRGPIPRPHFESWLQTISGRVVRAKGFVRFTEAPRQRHLLQLVDTVISVTPQPDAELETDSVLVVIAQEINQIPDPFN
jgi:G3E family GTPase